MSEIELAYSVGIVTDAGLDTTSVQTRTFTLADLSYPDFIPKAQKELDEVVGPDRLPTIGDGPKLSHMAAGALLCLTVFRMRSYKKTTTWIIEFRRGPL